MGAVLALCSSLCWGAGDFLGGRASRSRSALTILFWSQGAMLLLMWCAVAVGAACGALDVQLRVVAIGAAGGCAGVLALAAFYRALARGPMSVVPPIAAAGVVVPVAVGLASGAPPTTRVLFGLAIATIGVVLASVGESAPSAAGAPGARIAPATLGLCLLAACGFALVFVALDAAAGDRIGQAVLATAGVRLGSFLTLVVMCVVGRIDPRAGVDVRSAVAFAGIGALDTGANLLFAMANTVGELEVVAVLGSLYPAVTSGLAHVLLGERLGRLQFVGVACALVGIAALAGR